MAERTSFTLRTIILVSAFGFAWPRPGAADLGSHSVSDDAVLALGGSFNPPTMQHMSMFAVLMHRYGFRQAKMVPTWPYKPGSLPGEVTLELSQRAVEHFDEVLRANAIAFSEFRVLGRGKVSWRDKSGTLRQLEVDDFEVKNRLGQDTYQTLRYLANTTKGGARNVYWLSGGDSFASSQTWRTEWQQLFDVNWVVLARPALESAKGLDASKTNPLRGLFPDGFVDGFAYRRGSTGVHQYERDGGSVFVVSDTILDGSSSRVREELADVEGLQDLPELQPSLYEYVVRKGFYAKGERERYNLKNLAQVAASLLARFEARPDDGQARHEFEEALGELVRVARIVATEERKTPAWKRRGAHVLEGVKEAVTPWKLIPNVRAGFREVARRGGRDLALLYGANELIVEPIGSAILGYKLGGLAGAAALRPFFHLEPVLFPTYFAVKGLRHLRSEWRLAQPERTWGNRQLLRTLNAYRDRLQRGNPHRIRGRVEMAAGLGLGDGALPINIVASRFPRWVPYAIRKWDDRRTVWHDLNVSHNELEAMLGDETLARVLKEVCEGDQGERGERLRAQALTRAVYETPETRRTLRLFAAHRFFRHLHLGDMPPDLIRGLPSVEDREFVVRELKESGRIADLKHALHPRYRKLFSQAVANAYMIRRVLPEVPPAEQAAFWDEVIDLWATHYPGKRFDAKDAKQVRRVTLQLAALRPLIALQIRNAGTTELRYRGRPLARVTEGEGGLELVSPELRTMEARLFAAESRENTELRRVIFQAQTYLHEHAPRLPEPNRDPRLTTRSRLDRGQDIERQRNLTWEIEVARSEIGEALADLDDAYPRALRYLAQRKPVTRAARVFDDAREVIRRQRLPALLFELRQAEMEWVRHRREGASEPGARHTPTAGSQRLYDASRARVTEVRTRIEAAVFDLRTLTQQMIGLEKVSIHDLNALRREVGARFALDGRRLGARLPARAGHALRDAASSLRRLVSRPRRESPASDSRR